MFYKVENYALSIVTVFICLLLISQASFAQDYVCLPTCDTDDAKFLGLWGTDLETLNGATIAFGIRSPGENASVELGVFDGDRFDSWDLVAMGGGSSIEITLYADPNNDGSGNVVVAQWQGDMMPDDDWFVINQPNVPGALAADGDYIYKLEVRNLDPNIQSGNNFKLRTDGRMRVLPFEIFSFISTIGSVFEDLETVYPNADFNDPVCVNGGDFCDPEDPACCLFGSTYSGDWCFSFIMPEDVVRLEMFDGDFDYASSMVDVNDPNECAADGVDVDTDDLNTPNDILFPWAIGTTAVFEGAAGGDPHDDVCFRPQRRDGSVTYNLEGPQGSIIVNENPSGTSEWERFSITTGPLDPMVDDVSVSGFESGQWFIKVFDLDQSNLNVIRFPFAINGEDENGDPVPFDPEPEVSNVPTMSEWGMLAVAVLLGIVGFMAIRRKQAV